MTRLFTRTVGYVQLFDVTPGLIMCYNWVGLLYNQWVSISLHFHVIELHNNYEISIGATVAFDLSVKVRLSISVVTMFNVFFPA